MRSLTLATALALLVSPAWAQDAPGWAEQGGSSRAEAGEGGPAEAEAGGSSPAGAAEAAPATRTAEAEGAWDKLIAFFFGREGKRERSWGLVPLVVADSNAGFGGGIEFAEDDLFGTGVAADVFTTYSSKEFFDGHLELTAPAHDLLEGHLSGGYQSKPRLCFHGIGNETRRRDRLSLWLERTLVEARVGFTVVPHLRLYATGEFSNVNARDGRDTSVPPVSARFDEATLTGFTSEGFTNGLGGSVVIDFRDDRLVPTKGARIELRAVYHGPELGDSPYRFGDYAADAAIYVPLFAPWKLVLAAGARFEAVDASLGRVPFYALPELGGTRSLRGFLGGRFRDRNATLFQGEFRFPVWRAIWGALFVDTGCVYSDFRHPPSPFFRDFHFDFGAGIRLVLQPRIFTRLDFAVSNEEFTFALDFGNAF